MAKRFDILAQPDSDAKTVMLAAYRIFAQRFSVPGQSEQQTADALRELHEHGFIDFVDCEGGLELRLRNPADGRWVDA